ncbi:septum formation initiator family protein, partial [Patescibacteria group bacterium]|nr:septum formation initiator family protein [Patescibacteria group bacterium]
MEKVSTLKKIISSKALTYLLILLLFFGLVSLGKEINRRLVLKKEFSNLENQINLLEIENQQILKEIEQMQTDYFKERQARLKLGLQKLGEQVVVIQDNEPTEAESKI